MLNYVRRYILAPLCLGLAILAGTFFAAGAQEAGQAKITLPELDSFPRITAYLDVRDAQGNFIYSLEPDDVRVLEDEHQLPVAELTLLQPGVQFVVAVNTGPAFAIRNAQGLTRYELLLQSIQAWVTTRKGTTLDDLSVIVSDGFEVTHLSDPDRWFTSLQTYQPDRSISAPGYEVLSRALEIATDTSERKGMGRAVLLITSLPEQELGIGLQSLVARASQNGVRIFVCLIASPDRFSSQGAQQLAEMVAQTGGALFAFSGHEPIPNLEEYLEPLRNKYRLVYDSRITASGPHQLAAQVNTGHIDLTSPAQEFALEVHPPNVAFVSPRLEIDRLSATDNKAFPDNLEPLAQTLEILIEFPDGYNRPLKQTSLYVDGVVSVINSEPPFDQFTWDLSNYKETGEHKLQVEVVDSLGLISTSMELTVLVTVQQDQMNALISVSRNQGLIAGLAVILAGAVLLLVLIQGGRLRPGASMAFRRRRRIDPVTQPVRVKHEPAPSRLPGWINRLHWPQRHLSPKSYAFLAPISESGQNSGYPPISISSDEITIGHDPMQATLVLDDPSIGALHARLCRKEDGSFRISDEGSTAGTWVNYSPVSQEGAPLEHGDLVHIGRIGFRFNLREPERIRKPVIIQKEL